jgi:PIN domain nuclease of toxin-antitoxin system
MGYLLDTHTLLWVLSGSKRLPENVRLIIKDLNKPCFLSIASLWEIAIKLQLGKLFMNLSLEDLRHFCIRNRILIMPIEFEHLFILRDLPTFHGDPFDRLIISQAIAENFIVITKDKKFKKYPVEKRWKAN